MKQTYESLLEPTRDTESAEAKRASLVRDIQRELEPLEHVHRFMTLGNDRTGVPVRQLIERAIETREDLPECSAFERERLPDYAQWHAHAEVIGRLRAQVENLDALVAEHPLRSLHAHFAKAEMPLDSIRRSLAVVEPLFERIDDALEEMKIPDTCRSSLAAVRALVDYGRTLTFLADDNRLQLLAPKSDVAKQFSKFRKDFELSRRELLHAEKAASGWREKLSPVDAREALTQAEAFEGRLLRFLSPKWWSLRGVLRRGYDFATHTVSPSYGQILKTLIAEHDARAKLAELETKASAEYRAENGFDAFTEQLAKATERVVSLPANLRTLHAKVLNDDQGGDLVRQLADLHPIVTQLSEQLGTLLDNADGLMSWQHLRDEVELIAESLDDFAGFKPILELLTMLPPSVAGTWRHARWTADQMEAAIVLRTTEDLLRSDPLVAKSSAQALERRAKRLSAAHDRWRDTNSEAIRDRLRRKFLENVRLSSLPHAQLTPEQKEWKPRYNRGRRELEHEFGKTMRYRSIRDLISGETGLVVSDLKPVWLMSPLSVSDTLPLAENPFDVVIFDEASQVTLEEAIPAIYRAKQVIIVGDEKQLPPTNFFAARAKDDEPNDDEVDAELSEIDSDSLLNHAARTLPATMLRWHYRSRSESLISFSNSLFYDGRLFTVPDANPPRDVPRIAVPSAESADANVGFVLDRPISFHRVESGVYVGRRNVAEAEYIARLVRGLLIRDSGLTIGVIAFSEAQQGEIEQALGRLADEDESFRTKLEAEYERELDGQFIGLLVKNLENIQGDERDLILLSVCYAPGPNGKMLMNFGPINQAGGERRLNVAFSRAKRHMALVTTIQGHQITNDYNDGARALKNYIRYAEAASDGDSHRAERILWEINPASDVAPQRTDRNVVTEQLAAALAQRGHGVDKNVGQSEFRCDLAIRSDDGGYRLGILVDSESYYRNADVLERDVFRPCLLRTFGWEVTYVTGRDWFANAAAVLDSIDAILLGDGIESDPSCDASIATASQATDMPKASPPVPHSQRRYFELVEGVSKKFWEITVDGAGHKVRFGRLGAQGQIRSKSFADEATAQRDAAKLIREKVAKGYIEPNVAND